jgi:long-chain fatty acid transport protein
MIRINLSTCSTLVGALLIAGSLHGQAGTPTIVQLSLSNPGARSLGFGGAFVALADDATAAFANPAGLTQISRSEVSVEGRLWSYSTPYTAGGRISGQPTGNLLDDTPGLRAGLSSATTTGLSFLSFVYPKESWRLAFFRHQYANFESATETQGLFSDRIEPDQELLASSLREGRTFRIGDLRTLTVAKIVTYGVTGAYRLTESLSIGAGLSYFDSVFTNRVELFAAVGESLPDGAFGPNTYVEEARVLTSEITTADGTDWGLTAGILWRVNRQWSVGAFYRQGPKVGIELRERSGPAFEPFIPDGTVLTLVSSPMGFPDVYGLGAAYKSRNGAVTLSFEWDRVQYATIFESMDRAPLDTEDLELDDGDELHLGFEYVFINSTPVIALRSGVWRDPDHQFRYVGDDEIVRALLRTGKDEVHFTVGLGLVFKKVQFDIGIDLSDLVDTASFSAIYSF